MFSFAHLPSLPHLALLLQPLPLLVGLNIGDEDEDEEHYDMLALTKNCQSGVQIVKCICLKISDGTHTEPIK